MPTMDSQTIDFEAYLPFRGQNPRNSCLERDDGAPDDVAVTQPCQVLVDVVEPDFLQRVCDLALLGQRDDLAQVVGVAPKRAVIRELSANKGKQGHVDAGPDQADR